LYQKIHPQVGHPRQLRHVVGQRAEAALLVAQRRLGPPPLGDVARDLAGADDDVVFVADRRDREFHVEQAAIARAAHGLEAADALAGEQPRHDRVFFGAAIFRDDERDVAAHGLVGRVAEHARRRDVPRDDDAAGVLGDDRVFGRLDDRAEETSWFEEPGWRGSVVAVGRHLWREDTALARARCGVLEHSGPVMAASQAAPAVSDCRQAVSSRIACERGKP
jgi:hypothetical protein